MKRSASKYGGLEDQIAALETMARAELVETWERLYKAPPFKGIRNQTLVRGIALQIQIKTLGGLKPGVSKKLVRIAIGEETPNANFKPPVSLSPGSKLIRDWNGRSYEVDVLDKGFQLNGQTYGPLSAIAKSITGAHWSGPRFFGVRQ